MNVSAKSSSLRSSALARFGAGLALLLLAACSLPEAMPDPTRFYVLTSNAVAASPGAVAQPVRVYLRSVLVPDYLRGKLMQVRLAENEVRYVDQARWAETLEPGLARVVRENLVKSGTVDVVPRAGDAHAFEIVLQVRRCEGVLPAGVARLAVRIEIYSTDLDPQLLATDEFSTDVAGWDGQDYGQLAAKLSEAATQLAEHVVGLLPKT